MSHNATGRIGRSDLVLHYRAPTERWYVTSGATTYVVSAGHSEIADAITSAAAARGSASLGGVFYVEGPDGDFSQIGTLRSGRFDPGGSDDMDSVEEFVSGIFDMHRPNARKNISAVIDAFRARRPYREATCSTDGHTLYSYGLPIASYNHGEVEVLDLAASPSRTTSGQIRAVKAEFPGARTVGSVMHESAYGGTGRHVPNSPPLRPNARHGQLPLGETSSGKPVMEPTTGPYVERFPLPKWNRKLTVLGYVNVPSGHVRRLFPEWTKADHRDASEIMSMAAQAANDEWNSLVASSVKQYGDGDGALVSGVYRDHFPESTKEALRYLAHFMADAQAAAAFHHHASGARTPWRRKD